MTKKREVVHDGSGAMRVHSRRSIRTYDGFKWIVLGLLAILHLFLMLSMCGGSAALGECDIDFAVENVDGEAVDLADAKAGDLLTISGKNMGDNEIEVFENGISIGTSGDIVDGAWSLAQRELDSAGDRAYTFKAINPDFDRDEPATDASDDDNDNNQYLSTCNDNSDNTFAVGAPAVVVDTVDTTARVAPNFAWGAIAAGGTALAATQIDLDGTGSPASQVQIDLDGDVVETVAVGDAGKWAYAPGTVATAGLAVGLHKYTATALDADGNVTDQTAEYPFYVSAKPVVASHEINADGTALLAGTAIASSTGKVFLDGAELGDVDVDADGNWTLDTADAVAPGSHIVTIDQLGTVEGMEAVSSDNYPFEIAGAEIEFAPAVVNADAETTVLDSSIAQFGGTVDPVDSSVVLTLEGTEYPVTVAADGSWTYDVPDLPPGDYEATATATAPDGTVSTQLLPFIIPAALTFDSAVADSPEQQGDDTITADLVLGGQGYPGGTVELFDPAGESLGTTTVADDGTWTYTAVGYNGAAGAVDLTANQTINGTLFHTDVPNSVELAIVEVPTSSVLVAIADTEDATALGTLPTVELILDASWSMTFPPDSSRPADRLTAEDPGSRINIAQTALLTIIDESLPEGAPVAVRAFGNLEGNLACRTDLMQPVAPLDKAAVSGIIKDILPQYNANTDIAGALAEVPSDLEGVTGDIKVVLLTDGKETCGGNPEAEIAALREAGIDVAVDIVGFAIADDALKAQFEGWADVGGGVYYDASDSDSLVDALGTVFGIPYQILSADGEVVAEGRIGSPVEVPDGDYSINILTNPEVPIENVTVAGGETIIEVK